MGNFAATIFMVKEFGQDFHAVIKAILSIHLLSVNYWQITGKRKGRHAYENCLINI